MKEIAIGIDIPVKVESAVWSTIIYNQTEKAGIYLKTQDRESGRIKVQVANR
ncbi:hypothetical protein [Bacteroides sp. 519]|uniref:hypothetical protein n=1 Tax=Bacteroides sp. 519 TaxID=2302937 RepID=UPI0013D22A89|nr:hypothetical protein [Bacteroides sp. 519]